MLAFLQSALTYSIPFVLVLGLVVTVHELGHFLAARAFGVAVDRFAIGFGRSILSWKDRAGVEWRVGWLPLGGYVRFSGDDNEASVPDGDHLEALRRDIIAREGPQGLTRYFHFKPLWQRAIVVAGGPLANFLLAIALFALLLMTVGQAYAPSRISAVRPDSPAAAAGFQPGDVIRKAAGRGVDNFFDLQRIIMLRTGERIDFVVDRGGREIELSATPVRQAIRDDLGNVQHVGVLGVEGGGQAYRKRYAPPQAVVEATRQTWRIVDTTVFYLGRLFVGKESADQLSGPIGMAQISGAVAKQTASAAPDLGSFVLGLAVSLLGLAATISVGIGFLNLMPVPVLDGGHLLFYAYEAVARRPLTAKVQAAGFRLGLALVLGLMLFATWNDLQRLRVFKLLGGILS